MIREDGILTNQLDLPTGTEDDADIYHGIAGTNQRRVQLSEAVRNRRLSLLHKLPPMQFQHGYVQVSSAGVKIARKLRENTYRALNIVS